MKTIKFILAILSIAALPAVSFGQYRYSSPPKNQYKSTSQDVDFGALIDAMDKKQGVDEEGEISLYDQNGYARAYIAKDLTIYLWLGDPVAYLDNSNGNWNVFGFNGVHLGWFEEGVIYNKNGDIVGAQKGALQIYTAASLAKSPKSPTLPKSPKEIPSIKPMFSKSWSQSSLGRFLNNGKFKP